MANGASLRKKMEAATVQCFYVTLGALLLYVRGILPQPEESCTIGTVLLRTTALLLYPTQAQGSLISGEQECMILASIHPQSEANATLLPGSAYT